MELIKNHYNPALPVTNWNAIEGIAKEMEKVMATKQTSIMAMHHCYVSEKPLNFFILNDIAIPKEFIEQLGSKYIVNPRIDSFVKSSVMDMPEGCVGFPYRSPKNVTRAFILKVSYEIPDPLQRNGLKKIEGKEVQRIIAQIFQHEIDHSKGINIFFDAPKK